MILFSPVENNLERNESNSTVMAYIKARLI